MTIPEVAVFTSAVDLPEAWDSAAPANPFLRRENLSILERVNPCGQRYHLAPGQDGGGASVAVSYQHRLNLLTFVRKRLRWPVRMVGIPCSVAARGVCFGDGRSSKALLDHLRRLSGMTLILNTPEPRLGPGFISGPTLPCYRLRIRWRTFETYLGSMRSHYRHAFRRSLSRGQPLTVEPLASPASFTESLYALYREVFDRSAYPLECLSADFFRSFPARIAVFHAGATSAGFVQTLRHADTSIFLFGGTCHSLLARYDTYVNMLLHLVRSAVDSGAAVLDLGQTADTIKLKLGAEQQPLHLHVTHPSPPVRRVLGLVSGILSHQPAEACHHVFRA